MRSKPGTTGVRTLAICVAATLAPLAGAQTDAVVLQTEDSTVAPGDVLTISVVSTHDTAGALPGVFGDPGLYGFGLDVVPTGWAPLIDATSWSPSTTSPFLPSGITTAAPLAPSFVHASAGRGLTGGLAASPHTLFEFDLTIDPGAPVGDVVLDLQGAVVLCLGADLETFSTDPGPNQSTLAVTPLLIRVQTCEPDITTTNANPGDPGYGVPDDTVNGADLSYFVEQWLDANAAIADVTTTNANPGDPGFGAPDGTINGADLSYFVEVWLAGCP